MMYLSALFIDVGGNPDRPRPGRIWLRNLYRVHQRLCMAFPTNKQKERDPDFLMPYDPSGFHCPVHVPRDRGHNFLFRIDPKPQTGRAMILVQSGAKPDWDYAFHNAVDLLAAFPQMKVFDPRFEPQQKLRFRVLANPVRKVSERSVDREGKPLGEKWKGKDVPVPTGDLVKWLERRAEPGWSPTRNSESMQLRPGFSLVDIADVQGGYVHVHNPNEKDGPRRVRSALYEGTLEVTDAEHFFRTLIKGIGPGKAFGFGLLSVAPVPSGDSF